MKVVCTNPNNATREMKKFMIAVSDFSMPVHMRKMPYQHGEGFACSIPYAHIGKKTIAQFDALEFFYDVSIRKNPYYSDEFTRWVHKERSYARGFASVTLCLLHEMGHYYTVKEVLANNPQYNRGAEIFKICCKARLCENSNYEANRLYQQLPDEKAATDWALDWLADAEHRKIAKAFERKFFANYEKRA